MKVAIQGELGSFHHYAAISYFGNNVKIIACDSFKEVFECVKNKRCSRAVVAIENSLYGSINEVYDLLLKYKYPIIAEVPMRIKQSLIGLESCDFNSITHVYSHPVAIAQCSDYLDMHMPNADRIENHDTAGSVRLIKELNNPEFAAIASELAAKIYNLKIIKNSIENHNTNFTRFLVLSDKLVKNTKANKVSLVLQTSHKPGALYEALGVFANAGINLTKLQSRPIVGKVWKYRFYIDAETNYDKIIVVQKKLIKQGCQSTLLGLYSSTTLDH